MKYMFRTRCCIEIRVCLFKEKGIISPINHFHNNNTCWKKSMCMVVWRRVLYSLTHIQNKTHLSLEPWKTFTCSVYTFPALKFFMGGIYALNWAELNSMQFNTFWHQFDAIQKSVESQNSTQFENTLNCIECVELHRIKIYAFYLY